jgi:hypothetical protein
MNEENCISHYFKLNVAGEKGSTIFFCTIIPDTVKNIKSLDTGGAEITVRLPNGRTMTHSVVASKEEIESLIAKCKELDAQCQDDSHSY